MNGRDSSGFNNVVLSFKWQLPVSYGFILAAAGGLAFPFIRFASAADARSTNIQRGNHRWQSPFPARFRSAV
jgi:pilus assembly protein TadC